LGKLLGILFTVCPFSLELSKTDGGKEKEADGRFNGSNTIGCR
jgi:hypothetical protein